MEEFTLAIHIPRPSRETATHVWLILWKAFQAIGQNASRSVAELGLGQSDFAVLEVLMHKGPQPVNVIGRKVQLTSGSISAAVDRLESRKLLRRTAAAKDGRSRIVQLTQKGRHLIERAFQKHAMDMEETMAVLRSGERAELVRLLKRVGMWAAARLDDNGRVRPPRGRQGAR
jgi:MarR family transcriptional regulator, 2-MHQ and catechol-resistance regulon repressor